MCPAETPHFSINFKGFQCIPFPLLHFTLISHNSTVSWEYLLNFVHYHSFYLCVHINCNMTHLYIATLSVYSASATHITCCKNHSGTLEPISTVHALLTPSVQPAVMNDSPLQSKPKYHHLEPGRYRDKRRPSHNQLHHPHPGRAKRRASRSAIKRHSEGGLPVRLDLASINRPLWAK